MNEIFSRLSLMAIIIAAAAFCSCSDKDDEPGSGPGTSGSSGELTNCSWSGEVEAKPEGEVLTFTFTASGGWTAASNQSWCGVSPVRGRDGRSEIKAAIAPNNATSQRQATITIAIGSSRTDITIRQNVTSAVAPN